MPLHFVLFLFVTYASSSFVEAALPEKDALALVQVKAEVVERMRDAIEVVSMSGTNGTDAIAERPPDAIEEHLPSGTNATPLLNHFPAFVVAHLELDIAPMANRLTTFIKAPSAPLSMIASPLVICCLYAAVLFLRKGGGYILGECDRRGNLCQNYISWNTELLMASMLYVGITPMLMMSQSYLMSDNRFAYPFALNAICEVMYLLLGALANWFTDCKSDETLSPRDFFWVVLPQAVATVTGYASILYGMERIPLTLVAVLMSSQTVFTLAFSNMLGLERSSCRILMFVSIIAVGLLVSALGDDYRVMGHVGQLNHGGILLVGLSSLSLAFNTSLSELSVRRIGFINTGIWVQRTCVVIDLIAVWAVELRGPQGILSWVVATIGHGSYTVPAMMFAMAFTCAATMFAQYWLSLIVGGLAKSIIQAMRNPLTVVLSSVVIGQPCSVLTALGYCIVVCGVLLYHSAKLSNPKV